MQLPSASGVLTFSRGIEMEHSAKWVKRTGRHSGNDLQGL